MESNRTRIATTLEIERKREKLKSAVEDYARSTMSAMDIMTDFSNFTESRKLEYKEPARGYARLLNPKFQERQSRKIKGFKNLHPFNEYRVLTRLPKE